MCPKRIFLIGGTFNPPHFGHVKVIAEIEQRFSPDLILLIPTGIPPHKMLPFDTAKAQDRMEMLSLCVPKVQNVKVSDIEIKRQGKSYTVDTLNELKKQYPNGQFFLVMGNDMLLSLETWHEFEKILAGCTVVCVSRKSGAEMEMIQYGKKLEKQYGAKIEMMEMEPFEVSSSHIRDMVKTGQDISPYVEDKVRRYILENGLYRSEQ